MDGEQGEGTKRSRRHDGKDQWALGPAPAPLVGPIAGGDMVALNFLRLSPDHQGQEELLWVTVVALVGDAFEGELDNQPTWIRGLSDGERVAFERRHVVQLMRKRT